MRFYIEAYDKDDSQILGNLDGQAAFQAQYWRNTKPVRWIRNGSMKTQRVKYWRVVDERGVELEVIYNPYFQKHEPRQGVLMDRLVLPSDD